VRKQTLLKRVQGSHENSKDPTYLTVYQVYPDLLITLQTNQVQGERGRKKKDYFFDKKKVQLFFTLEFHAAVRGE
jgi:hypothetical protein